MCTICEDFENLSTLEAVQSLSKVIDDLNKKHAEGLLNKIAAREVLNFHNQKENLPESIKAFTMALELMGRVIDEDRVKEFEELKEMFDDIKALYN